MVKIDSVRYRVLPGATLRLDRVETLAAPHYRSEKHYQKLLAAQHAELTDHQELLYATGQQSVLMIFQAMES